MNKLKLFGIATMPEHDDDDKWVWADIYAIIDAEVIERNRINSYRSGLNIRITPAIVMTVRKYGYTKKIDDFIMRRIRACLNGGLKNYPGTEKDINTIYEVLRLKMPRFVSKSVEHSFYSWCAETGEIKEWTEDYLLS